jgi:hypothetical protein
MSGLVQRAARSDMRRKNCFAPKGLASTAQVLAHAGHDTLYRHHHDNEAALTEASIRFVRWRRHAGGRADPICETGRVKLLGDAAMCAKNGLPR